MRKLAAAMLFGLTLANAGQAQAADDVMIVFDGSNSMWGQIDGTAKIEIARDVMRDLMGDWAEGVNVGLMAYGHRREGDCSDIETLISPAPLDGEAFMSAVEGITPRGKTPLTSAVESAAEALSYRDNPATVVLITDGIETCERDPCELASELERAGVGLTAHVVGFALADEAEQRAVACIAENTGGRFLAADDADTLGEALSTVGRTVAEAPEPEPEPEPAPEVAVSAPDTVLTGASFRVSWSAPVQAPRDYVTIVPTGAEEGAYENYTRVGDGNEADLRAPADAGLYEVRYMRQEDGTTLGTRPIEVTEPEITVRAPESASTGSSFTVEWSSAVHPRDYVAIVPSGAEEGEYLNYARVGDGSEADLRAPAEAGLYEVRYVLQEGGRTMASAPIEITEPQVTVSAPETASTGSSFAVQWTGTIHPRDYVTIVPSGAEEGEYLDYARVGDGSEADLRAPAEAGLYEVRYVLQEGGRTMASAPIEITEPQVTVSAPETAVAGSSFAVQWTGTIHPRDYATIVPAGAEEGEYLDYARVGDGNEASLQAPAETGLYEVRYVLQEGGRTMASTPIEIVAPEVAIESPETAVTGSNFTVRWSNAIHPRDYVTIVPSGAEEGESGDYARVGKDSEARLLAPADTGLYEVRYVLQEGKRTLASAPIEVTAPSLTMSAPAEVRVGDTIDVSWEGENPHPRDLVVLVPAGTPEGEYDDYSRVGDKNALKLEAPEETGLYEVRYVLNEGKRTIAQATVELLDESAALDSGGSLTVSETAAPGETVEVEWSGGGGSSDVRVALARPNQADFTWIAAKKTDNEPPLMFEMPQDPGFYEFRLIDVSNRAILSRVVIEVQ